ncbi:MAG: single-stranded-DNA-specific exonuclease RecJ [Anaerolineaceae bacterium]|nr:single-stranded-DNA-specific exonuclease RecJ [Anaerolineaceae bacterium]
MMCALLEKTWQIANPIPASVSEELSAYSPVLRQLLFNRNIFTADEATKFINPDFPSPDPFQLIDMDKAVERILTAIREQQKIAVYGDYDADGVTATVLLTEALLEIGAQAMPYIPNRFDEGYGLNIEALDMLAKKGIELVITVDCGIRSIHEAEHAKKINLDMIITDHHDPGDTLPPAYANICPKRIADPYPEKMLSGVGIAYKLTEALVQQTGLYVEVSQWLDLVALGTVADIVPLTGENRKFVALGVQEIHKGKRIGLRALCGAAGLQNLQAISARDIGFMIAPRINAAGRLESASLAMDLLLCDEVDRAAELAQHLDDLNRQRQSLTRQIQETAETLAVEEQNEHFMFAVSETFNMGIVGLAASRLVDTHYRPAVVGAIGEEFTRASCRSIPELHITWVLDQVADLLVQHGGHAMAAGFTVRNDQVSELYQKMSQIISDELREQTLKPLLSADMEIQLSELHPSILDDIAKLEPCGQQNPPVYFVSRNLIVRNYRIIGRDRSHLKLTVSDGKITYDVIAFGKGEWAQSMPEKIDLLYAFERNSYNGRTSLQLQARDIKPAQES